MSLLVMILSWFSFIPRVAGAPLSEMSVCFVSFHMHHRSRGKGEADIVDGERVGAARHNFEYLSPSTYSHLGLHAQWTLCDGTNSPSSYEPSQRAYRQLRPLSASITWSI